MRTKWFVRAALAAIGLVLAACQISTEVDVYQNQIHLSHTGVTPGGCQVTISTTINGLVNANPANNSVVSGVPGDTADVRAVASGSCVTEQDFDFGTDNTAVATLNKRTSTSALLSLIANGQTPAHITHRQTGVQATFTVVVGQTNVCVVTGVVISAPSTTTQVGTGVQLSAAVNSVPAGCATRGVTWSIVSGPGTISASGFLTPNGAGAIVVRATSVDNPNISGTYTITATSTTSPTISPIGPISTGNGCLRTFQGVVSPAGTAGTWSVSSLSGLSVNSSTGAGTVPQVTANTQFTLTFTPTNGTAVSIAVTLIPNDCSQAVSIVPAGPFSTGNGCTLTQQLSTNPANAAGTWRVISGIANYSISSSGMLTAVANTSGSLIVGFTPTGGSEVTTTIVFNNTNCTPPPTIGVTWTPTSVCFSTVAGSPTSVQVRAVISGVTNPTVTLVSSNNSFVGITNPITQTGNDLTWTVNRVNAIAADGNLALYYNGQPISAIPWDIRTTACPGTGSSIVYSPPSSTGTVGTTAALNVTSCIINGVNCTTKPFWDSSDPSRVGVRGTETEVYGGMTFYVGMQATLTRVAAGSAQICVQPAVTITTPRYCGSGGNSHVVQ